MITAQKLILSVLALVFALYNYIAQFAANTPTMPQPRTSFIAQRGYFSHDSDPERWDFRATTRPNLGLQERDYLADGDLKRTPKPRQWSLFIHHIK
jgi:hypothetical protein